MQTFKIYTISEDIKSKLRNIKNLSRKERDKLLTFFRKHNHLQGGEGGINWQNKNLKFKDFSDVIERGTVSGIKSNTKKHGIKGLRDGKDYIDVSHMFPGYHAYIPMNFEASKALGSKYIGTCEGKWCTSSNRPATWNEYTQHGVVIIILISYDGKEKYALATHDRLMDVEIFGKNGKEVNSVPDVDAKRIARDNIRELVGYARIAQKHIYNNVKWITKAQTDDAEFEATENNEILWHDGIWIKGTWVAGTWMNGVWLNGTWRTGTWENGVWKKGKWEHGDFEGGVWQDGVWVTGNFKDGAIWEKGDWLYGIWYGGTWNGGTFHGGIWVDGEWNGGKWIGGMDQNKDFHGEDDSPDKW